MASWGCSTSKEAKEDLMTELDYVVEKVELALNIMATGDGDLKVA